MFLLIKTLIFKNAFYSNREKTFCNKGVGEDYPKREKKQS